MFILKAENTEKAGHNVKPRLPGKMCTLTSVVRSQHATGQTMRICIPRTSISEYNKAFRARWCVLIQRSTEHSSLSSFVQSAILKCLYVSAIYLIIDDSTNRRPISLSL